MTHVHFLTQKEDAIIVSRFFKLFVTQWCIVYSVEWTEAEISSLYDDTVKQWKSCEHCTDEECTECMNEFLVHVKSLCPDMTDDMGVCFREMYRFVHNHFLTWKRGGLIIVNAKAWFRIEVNQVVRLGFISLKESEIEDLYDQAEKRWKSCDLCKKWPTRRDKSRDVWM